LVEFSEINSRYVHQLFISKFKNMSILIKAVERGNPQKPEEPHKFYATVATRGIIDLDGLSEQIALNSSLSRGDIYSVLLSLFDVVPREMLDGKLVKLGNLGSMSLNLDSEGMESAEKVTGDTVKSVHLVFRPTKELREELRHFSIRTS